MKRHFNQEKIVKQAPAIAKIMARLLFAVIFSFKKIAARIKIKMVDIWFKIAAWDALVYFMPETQNKSPKKLPDIEAGRATSQALEILSSLSNCLFFG